MQNVVHKNLSAIQGDFMEDMTEERCIESTVVHKTLSAAQKNLLEGIPEECGIESTVAMFRNFSPEKSIENSVVYVWESHTANETDKVRTAAAADWVGKDFDLATCEKYEVRTGYLSRYNYLPHSFEKCSQEDIDNAIASAMKYQEEWVAKCAPYFPSFLQKNWQYCVDKYSNSFWEECRDLILVKIRDNEEFCAAFYDSVNEYAEKNGTCVTNGQLYILEELAWILTLPLLHPIKQIYLIHVGSANSAVTALFHHFSPYLRSVKWLSPRFVTKTFYNTNEFLLEYRNSKHAGYSYAIEKKESIRTFLSASKKQELTKDELLHLFDVTNSNLHLLSSIIAKLPGHIYWLNKDNVYLGCNDLQAAHLGLQSREDICGKTNYNFHYAKDAEALDIVNTIVMNGGEEYEGEEPVSFLGVFGHYWTHKTPLRDSNGNIIGLLGVSMDITDRKRAEELEFQNKLQKAMICEQGKFRTFIMQVAHDICAPLASLECFMKDCDYMPAENYSILKGITSNIRNIADDLLYKHKDSLREECEKQEQCIAVSLALMDVVNHKQLQYKKENVIFNCEIDEEAKFLFIKCDQSNFSRMISNVIDNAVEASGGNNAKIDIALKLENAFINISISDHGVGMPQSILHRIVSNIPIGTTKKSGNGLGMEQVRYTLGVYNGYISIDSKEGLGTKIELFLPVASNPNWIATDVKIKKNSTIIVLDDDMAVYHSWRNALRDHLSFLDIKYFSSDLEAANYIDSYPIDKIDNLYMFADFEVCRNSASGLNIILQNKLNDRALIVTNVNYDKVTNDLVASSGVKILPKQFIHDISVIII